jgi:hypothetical protein
MQPFSWGLLKVPDRLVVTLYWSPVAMASGGTAMSAIINTMVCFCIGYDPCLWATCSPI